MCHAAGRGVGGGLASCRAALGTRLAGGHFRPSPGGRRLLLRAGEESPAWALSVPVTQKRLVTASPQGSCSPFAARPEDHGARGEGLPSTCLVPSLFREHQMGPCEKETVRTHNPTPPTGFCTQVLRLLWTRRGARGPLISRVSFHLSKLYGRIMSCMCLAKMTVELCGLRTGRGTERKLMCPLTPPTTPFKADLDLSRPGRRGRR